jgi:hypothetical protein
MHLSPFSPFFRLLIIIVLCYSVSQNPLMGRGGYAVATKWQTLRAIAGLAQIGAYLVGLLGIFAILATIINSASGPLAALGYWAVVIEVLFFGTWVLGALGGSELIMLFIAVEENTAATAQHAHATTAVPVAGAAPQPQGASPQSPAQNPPAWPGPR